MTMLLKYMMEEATQRREEERMRREEEAQRRQEEARRREEEETRRREEEAQRRQEEAQRREEEAKRFEALLTCVSQQRSSPPPSRGILPGAGASPAERRLGFSAGLHPSLCQSPPNSHP